MLIRAFGCCGGCGGCQLACPLVPGSSAACGEGLGRAVLEQRRVCVAVDEAEPTCSQVSYRGVVTTSRGESWCVLG